jgi:2-oxoglutarate ferredoxin oxidoreductase subunit delta
MIKGRVSFNEDTCKGCGLCVSVCPVKILKLDTSRVNAIGYTPRSVLNRKNASRAPAVR